MSVVYVITVSTQSLNTADTTTAMASLTAALASESTVSALAASLSEALGVDVTATASTVALTSVEIAHSAKPSGTPTANPTKMQCRPGTYHNPIAPDCLICAAGSSSGFDAFYCPLCVPGKFSGDGSPECSNCQQGDYSDKPGAANACLSCQWPYYNSFPGSPTCDGINISISGVWYILFFIVCFALYAACVALVGFQVPAMVVFSLFPALDVISDLVYLITNNFYRPAFFYLCITFIVLPNVIFLRKLREVGALTPHYVIPQPTFLADNTLLWLGYRGGFPLYKLEKLSRKFRNKPSTHLATLSIMHCMPV